jgi:hypothetical protein
MKMAVEYISLTSRRKPLTTCWPSEWPIVDKKNSAGVVGSLIVRVTHLTLLNIHPLHLLPMKNGELRLSSVDDGMNSVV